MSQENLPALVSSQQTPEKLVLVSYDPQKLTDVKVRKQYQLAILNESKKWIALVKVSVDKLLAANGPDTPVPKLAEESASLMNLELQRKSEIDAALQRLQAVPGMVDRQLVQLIAQVGGTELSLYRDARLKLDLHKAAQKNNQPGRIHIRVNSGQQVRLVLSVRRK